MKNTILTILLALFFSFLNAQGTRSVTVTGHCYLEDESDHSGTRVLFTAVSGSAVTDSVFTESDGSYTAGITEGIYTIVYSHDGFLPYTIPGELNFFDDIELETLTLAFGNIQELSGTLSGNQYWTSDYQYWVTGDLSLSQGDTLTIDPGVNVLFMGFFEFNIEGVLHAVGTEEDSIRFTSGQPEKNKGDWKWLYFDGNSDSTSTSSLMAYTVVEYGGGDGTSGDYANIRCWEGAELVMQNCRVSHSIRHGIRLQYSADLTLTESSVHDNNDNGIYVWNYSTADISGNDIHNNNSHGILVYGNSTADISGNDIHNNNSRGIYVWNYSTADISGNDIHNN
ncbi:MAG: right-handed parallel beta-helix repeat-containing protein, partial [Anaerolineales bacterium]|nr:right-handed parallel beta-helix repeat-containing protein [Anaerolineales bacterium]